MVLIRIILVSLDEPEDRFDQRFAESASFLRVINYPETAPDLCSGKYRCEPHTDYGTVSILLAENRPGGLQVRTEQGEWLDTPTPAGAFLINIGDLMEQWTARRFRATVHRVGTPPDDAWLMSRRHSWVFFHNPAEIRAQVEAYLRS